MDNGFLHSLSANREAITLIVSWVSAILAVWSLWLCFKAAKSKESTLPLAKAGLLWAVLPPFWFWFEYFALYKPIDSTTQAESFEAFRHGQQLAGAMWIGLVGAILATIKYVNESQKTN